DVVGGPEIDIDPLRVADRAAPARAAVAVHGVGGGERVALDRGDDHGPAERQVGAGHGRSRRARLAGGAAGAGAVHRHDDVVAGDAGRDRGVLVGGPRERRRGQRRGRFAAGGPAWVDVVPGHDPGGSGPGQVDLVGVIDGHGQSGRRRRYLAAVDVEVEQRVAVLGGAGGAEDAHVLPGAGQPRIIVPARSGVAGDAVKRGPGGRVVAHLDLVVLAGGGFPVELHLADVVDGPAL